LRQDPLPTAQSRSLDRAIAAGAVGVVLVVTLLYSSSFSDNFLAKSAVATGISLWVGLLWWIRQGSEPRLCAPALVLPMAVFFIQALSSAFTAQSSLRAGEVWLGYVSWIALLTVGSHVAQNSKRLRGVLRIILITSCAVVATGLLQYNQIDLIGLPVRYRGLPVATLGNTNFVAHYLDLILPLAAALLLPGAVRAWDRCLAAVVLLGGGLLLLLSQSRGGWVSIGVAVTVVASLEARPTRWIKRLVLLILCLGLLSPLAELFLGSLPVNGEGRTAQDVVGELAQDAWERGASAFDEENFSRSMRILIWHDAWRMATAQSWFGVGPGHWGIELSSYRTSVSHREWKSLVGRTQNQPNYAHQEFLQEWGETGLLGAVCLVVLLGTTFILCWRVARSVDTSSCVDPPLQRAMGLAAVAAVTATCTHALFSFNLRDPVVTTHLWLIVGFALGAGGAVRRYAVPAVVKHVVTVALVCLAALGTWMSVSTLLSDTHLARGLRYVDLKQGNRATLEFEEAVAWRGHDYRASHWLGKVHLEMGRPSRALPPLQRSLQLHAHNAAALRLAARAAIELEQPKLAVDLARKAVAVDPLTPDNYQLLALGQRADGRPEDAVAAWRQAVAFRPEDAELLSAMAQDLHAAGQTLDAVFVLEQALKLKPRNGRSYGNLGAFYLQLRRLPEAESHLRRALQLDKANGAQWSANLVQSLMLQEQWTQALKQVRSSLRAHPEDERLRHLLRTLEDRQEIR
jgi:O-antigen ligase/tetratricopeptide (TPR) repeat protein